MRLDTRAKHTLVDLQNDQTPIYRLIEIHHLFELFETKFLTLVTPKLWDDPYENFLEHCYGVVPSEPNHRYSYNGYTKLIFGNCWTLNQDTDATWRIYSPNKRKVKIKTTVAKLYALMNQVTDKWFRSYIGKVTYLSEEEIKSNIVRGIKEGSFFIDTLVKNFYLKKRDTFSDEREIRLLVRLNEPEERVINAKYQNSENLDICQLPINDPVDFIDEIVFDPRMPNSLVRAYETHLTKTFNFNKKSYKSKIYESPGLKVEIEKKY